MLVRLALCLLMLLPLGSAWGKELDAQGWAGIRMGMSEAAARRTAPLAVWKESIDAEHGIKTLSRPVVIDGQGYDLEVYVSNGRVRGIGRTARDADRDATEVTKEQCGNQVAKEISRVSRQYGSLSRQVKMPDFCTQWLFGNGREVLLYGGWIANCAWSDAFHESCSEERTRGTCVIATLLFRRDDPLAKDRFKLCGDLAGEGR